MGETRPNDRADFRLIAKGFGIPLVEAAAKERQTANLKRGTEKPRCGKLPQREPVAKAKTRDIVGAAVGMSGGKKNLLEIGKRG